MERETLIGCLMHTPYWGSSLKPGHVSWLEIEQATIRCMGQCSANWATLAKTPTVFNEKSVVNLTEIPLYVISCFSLAALKILFCFLAFIRLTIICLGVELFMFTFWTWLNSLDMYVSFSSCLGKFWPLFKYF